MICLDNLFTSQKSNIAHLLNKSNFEFIRHDIVHPFFLEVDEIYNLACPASPPHYQFNPVKTLKTSVIGAINMLGLAKRTKAKNSAGFDKRKYMASRRWHPQPESYWGNVNPIGVRSLAMTKENAALANAFLRLSARQNA